MDHHGGNFMAIAILAGLVHRNRTGEGQWIDMACTEAGATLNGPTLLDWTVNGRPLRRPGMPHSNHSQHPPMAPHDIYPSAGHDQWVAVSCRDDGEWARLAAIIGEPWAADPRFATLAGRLEHQVELDELMAAWTTPREKQVTVKALLDQGIPAAIVAWPEERVDHDPNTAAWGLWPTVAHREMGRVRVDGIPIHLSETDWVLERGAPCLGQHNEEVFGGILGLSTAEIAQLREAGAI
jgi:crotonobetainyl-CoA:carnitine CoA-transferase CaiB-like acyl-CoA transferase